jgi:hypothetical protein
MNITIGNLYPHLENNNLTEVLYKLLTNHLKLNLFKEASCGW